MQISFRFLGFGATIMGKTHKVRPWTCSIIFRSLRHFSSFSTFDLKWKRILLCHWATGVTDLSIYSFTLKSFISPTFLLRSGCSRRSLSTCHSLTWFTCCWLFTFIKFNVWFAPTDNKHPCLPGITYNLSRHNGFKYTQRFN